MGLSSEKQLKLVLQLLVDFCRGNTHLNISLFLIGGVCLLCVTWHCMPSVAGSMSETACSFAYQHRG